MSVKCNIPQVRTAQDLERKYNFSALNEIKNIQESTIKNSNDLKNTTKEINDFVKTVTKNLQETNERINNNEEEIKSKVEIWFFDGIPSLENVPTINWEEEEYASHIGDLYYDIETGYSYRFILDLNTKNYNWELFKDKDITDALSTANAAQDTADGKRRVFTSKPYTPYENGDLWLNEGEIFVCQISKSINEEFDLDDFINATDYETTTNAKKVKDEITSKLEVISGKVTTVESNTYKKTEIEQILEGNYIDENGNEIVSRVVKTISGTFDENGMHYEKSGSRVATTINEKGVKTEDIQSDKELLFSGYDEDLNESIVRTENLTVKKYFRCGNYSRFEDYVPDGATSGTGVFL